MPAMNDSITLLVLQLTFYRQQELVHQDPSLDLNRLIVEPIVDETILQQFVSHSLVKIYAPELTKLNLRSLRTLITTIFDDTELDEAKTLISLANHYYSKRINYLEEEKLPELISQIRSQLKE